MWTDKLEQELLKETISEQGVDIEFLKTRNANLETTFEKLKSLIDKIPNIENNLLELNDKAGIKRRL